MITFRFDNGALFTLRNSGTEPKIKYYIECSSTEGIEEARFLLQKMIGKILKELLKPDENSLVPAKK